MYNLTADDEKLLEQVIARAATDADFRQRLLTAPGEAIKAATGVVIPSTFRVRFIERSSDVDALIVLPDLVDETAELSAEELEAVAGGSICWTTCNNSCGTTNTCNGVTNVDVGLSPGGAH
jgi:hypothetical protein